MGRPLQLAGVRSGSLVARELVGTRGGKCVWLCDCDCGGTSVVRADAIKSGDVRSCGRCPRGGVWKLPGYFPWMSMLARCRNPKSRGFEYYGGLGISVCWEWIGPPGFRRFMDHIGPRPSPRHTIDRIDNRGNYEPGNVRWATPHEQSRNKRSNHMITCFGKTQCLRDWEHETGLCGHTIGKRIDQGWPVERALSEPTKRRAA